MEPVEGLAHLMTGRLEWEQVAIEVGENGNPSVRFPADEPLMVV